MRAIRVAPLALSGATALLLAAPAAHATQDGGNTSPFVPTVTPSVIAPGGQVTLGSGGCSGGTTVTSGVFDTAVIPSGSTTATATVDRDAQQGAIYALTFKCGSTGTAQNVSLTISGSATSATTAPAPLTPATTTTTGTATAAATTDSTSSPAPSGVQGGLGGSVGSLDTQDLAMGAALVVAAATGTVFFVRRRDASRR